MKDLIDRQEAIRIASGYCHTANIAKELERLPSAQPEQRWIPCGDRLPKDEEEVMVSIHDDSGDSVYDYTSSGWYAAAGKFWVVDNEINRRVTAWMPLPEPYKAERKEDED